MVNFIVEMGHREGDDCCKDGYICGVLSNYRLELIKVWLERVSFLSVAVITCASHAQGRRFEPGRKHMVLVKEYTGLQYLFYRKGGAYHRKVLWCNG